MHYGPFYIAATYHAAIGDEVGSLVFEESKLRPHAHSRMLQAGKIFSFSTGYSMKSIKSLTTELLH